MREDEFTNAMIVLGSIYNKEFTKSQVAVWYEFFKNTSYEKFTNAIKRIGSTKTFLPSIAEIKEEITNITTKELQLDADVEWCKVLEAIRVFGDTRGREALESLNPYTAKIVKLAGWYRLCFSENILWEKKEFIRIFNKGQETIKEYQMLNGSDKELTYKEQLMLEEKELEQQELLELEA